MLQMSTINWWALRPRLSHLEGEAVGQLQLMMPQVAVMPVLPEETQGEDMSFQVCQHGCPMSPASSQALIVGQVAASVPTGWCSSPTRRKYVPTSIRSWWLVDWKDQLYRSDWLPDIGAKRIVWLDRAGSCGHAQACMTIEHSTPTSWNPNLS